MVVEEIDESDINKSFDIKIKNSSLFLTGEVKSITISSLSDIYKNLRGSILSFFIAMIFYQTIILTIFIIIIFFRKTASIPILVHFMAQVFITMMLSFSINIGNFIIINSFSFWNIIRLLCFVIMPYLSQRIIIKYNNYESNKIWILLPGILALIAIVLSHFGIRFCQTIYTLIEIYTLVFIFIYTLIPIVSNANKKMQFRLNSLSRLLYSILLIIYYITSLLNSNIGYYHILFDTALNITLILIALSSVSLFIKARQSLLKDDELQVLSSIDYLSGCLNRRSFEHDISNYWLTVDEKIFIVVIDINDMKKTNDTHGHDAGDSLIVHVAIQMSSLLTQTSRMYRIGGDEFVIIMPALDRSEEEVKTLVKELYCEKAPYSSSISVGVATSSRNVTLTDTFKQADRSMYQDKRNKYECKKY